MINYSEKQKNKECKSMGNRKHIYKNKISIKMLKSKYCNFLKGTNIIFDFYILRVKIKVYYIIYVLAFVVLKLYVKSCFHFGT